MLTTAEKEFFFRTALMCSKLCSCKKKEGSVITSERKILSYGFRKSLIREKPWEISAIYDAIFGARTENLLGASLFSSYFPSEQDMILLVSVGISSLYYQGPIEDMTSIQIANSLSEAHIPLEITQLEIT